MFLLAAISFGVLALAGVISNSSALMVVGSFYRPVQPLAAISYIAIAITLLAPWPSRPWMGASLLAIPAVVVSFTIFQNATGFSLEVLGWASSLGFPTHPSLSSGLLYVGTLASLTMLTLAVAIARHHGRTFSRAAAALASVTLGVSLMSAVIVIFGMASADEGGTVFLPSLPEMGQAIAISAAVLIWVGWPTLADIPGRGKKQTRIMRRALPLIVLVPAIIGLVEVLATKVNLAPPLVIDIATAGINIAIVAILVVWSITRFAAEHPALWETSSAMASAPIALTSTSGDIFHWSEGCEELFGWTAEQVVGRPLSEILQPQDVATTHVIRKPGHSQETQREVIVQCRDATTLHVIERMRVVKAEGRAPVVVYNMTDISERVKMEAALKESDANLLLALDAQQIGTSDWDLASRTMAVSAGMEQRLELDPGDLGELSGWIERVDPLDMAAITATIKSVANLHAERFNFHYRMKVPNGGVRSLEGSGRLIYDAQGALAKVMGVHIDVTDRNEREAALLAEQEQLRLVLKTVPSAMVIFDELGTIKAFSASAKRMFGYAANEALGRNVDILEIGPEVPSPGSFVDRYLDGGKSLVTDGTPVTYARRRDGSLVPIELWMGDMHIGSKRLFTGFAIDLSERLASERRLSEMNDELLHASRLSAMGEMAAGLAHELNQPLAATAYFLGAADLVLVEDTSCEQGRALLRLGLEQALRAGEIIRRMREFATRESIDMQLVQIGKIIEDAVSMAFLGEARYDIKLAYDLDPAAEVVLADRVQIAQVFVNLLRNATEELRKCSPVGRSIKIRTKALDDETVEVSVADSGPGLAPVMLDRVYMPFVSTKREQGMGVGLSICRRIIEAHGGTFSAANSPDGGAVFSFTLSTIPAILETNA